MFLSTSRIPAKILLFGEHTILRGSKALAIPLWSRGCSWQEGGTTVQQEGLYHFLSFLEAHFPTHFDLAHFAADLNKSWYLHSDIPIGYGLGSSASVCVGVFERYGTPEGNTHLKAIGPKAYFAQIERHFHGTSSGTDPLIIYERQSVTLGSGGRFQFVEIPSLPEGWRLFLLDTEYARATGPLVNYFTARYDSDDRFRVATNQCWTPATDAAIHAILAAQASSLWTAFRQISQFQLDELTPMVLPSLHEVWKRGLDTGTYLLKICGAGGGGYCLGITNNWQRTQQTILNWSLEPLEW